jgi:hypothetical protein
MVVGCGFGVLMVLGLDGLERFREGHPGRVEALAADLRRTWPFNWLGRRPR